MKLLIQLDRFTKRIKYKDINHSYTIDGSRLTSVTTVIKKYTPKFRSKYWRTYKALQASGYDVKSDASYKVQKEHIVINGVPFHYTDVLGGLVEGLSLTTTPADLMREWKYKALVGTTRGTILHNYLEHAWQGKEFPPCEKWEEVIRPNDISAFAESLHILRKQADNFLQDHSHLIPIKLEQIVGCPELRVAGQIDAILYNPDTNEYYLYDYKTDKKIDYDSPFDNMLMPIETVSACNYNKYSLQLAIYKHLLEKHTDIKISDCRVVWFNQYNLNYQSIKLKEMDEQAAHVLHHHANIYYEHDSTGHQ